MKVNILLFSLLLGFGNLTHKYEKDSPGNDKLVIADSCIHSFIFDFMYYEDFQLSGTKIKNWKYAIYF